MSQGTVRTRSHYYAPDELNALNEFYKSNNTTTAACAVTRGIVTQWAHILDAAILPTNERLAWMLARHLRQDRHRAHAAEVRENIIPLAHTEHSLLNATPPGATIFLHEDVLARTLAYEQELQEWRRSELRAGRTDPGRPAYEDVFPVFGVTKHRWHCARVGYETTRYDLHLFYQTTDCPGVEPLSSNPFPIIKTLLSIPFSLLHTLPRLISLVPHSDYTKDLVKMGEDIVRLWSWDPSPEELQQSEAIRAAAAGNVDQTRLPKPAPIHDSSRETTTFGTKRPQITFRSAPPVIDVIRLESGQVLLEKTPSVAWDHRDGLHLTEGRSWPEEDWSCERHEEESMDVDDGSVFVQSELSFDDGDTDSEVLPSSPPDISAWLQSTVNDEEPIPALTGSPFRKGVMGGMSVNDVLMLRGQIDLALYLDFLHLDSFVFKRRLQ